jgi:putative ABC transport system substrate-binding protein
MERRPRVVVVATLAAAKAIESLTRTTPIVMLGLNDPVGLGLVASLAHPGGNITGVDGMADQILLKEVELLREALPEARKVMLMINPTNPSHPPMVDRVTRVAHKIGLVVATVGVSAPVDLDAAFSEMSYQHPDALLVPGDNILLALANAIIERALTQRVPTIGNYVNGADHSGALISYARDANETYRSVARLIKNIFDGADPANLPVERPTKFVLTINLKIAKTLNLTMSQTLLVQADEVIE